MQNPSFHVRLVSKDESHLGTQFDDVYADLARQPRLHIEPDGFFIWSLDEGQISGTIYDCKGFIVHVELHGACSQSMWQRLIKHITRHAIVVNDLQNNRLYDLQFFEAQIWPPESPTAANG